MTSDEMKKIRQRLGWSRAEMARRHGADLESVDAWESGRVAPAAGVLNHYRFLEAGAEDAADQTAVRPAAESKLDADNLAQVTRRELLNEP